jgi:hypothetical protein
VQEVEDGVARRARLFGVVVGREHDVVRQRRADQLALEPDRLDARAPGSARDRRARLLPARGGRERL